MAEKAFLGTGRRKTSVARVRLAAGTGKIVVNGRNIENYFCTELLRGLAVQPLAATETAAPSTSEAAATAAVPSAETPAPPSAESSAAPAAEEAP